jgi:hypothetical protein
MGFEAGSRFTEQVKKIDKHEAKPTLQSKTMNVFL